MITNRVFFRFLATYALLISIPLAVGVLLNSFLVREYENHVKLSYIAHLSQTREIMETYLTDIKWSTYQIAGTTELHQLLNQDNSATGSGNGDSRTLLKNLVDELNRFLLYHTSFDSTFYIYLNHKDIIITPYSVYKHEDFEDSKTFFRMDTISSDEWHSKILSGYINGKTYPSRSVIIEDFKNKQMIPYVQSLPINLNRAASDVEAVIVYLIGESDIHRIMNNTNLPPGGITYIADQSGTVLTSIGEGSYTVPELQDNAFEGMYSSTLNNEDALFIYTTSESNGWRYVSILPEQLVLEKVQLFQLISFIGMFIAMVVSLSAASFISNRWAKPLTMTLRTIRSYMGTEQNQAISYNTLPTTVSSLVNKSSELQQQATRQSSFIKNAFVNRALHGFLVDREQQDSFLNYLNLDINGKWFTAALIKLWGYDLIDTPQAIDELNKTKILLTSVLEKTLNNRVLISSEQETVLSLLIFSDDPDRERGAGHIKWKINSFFSEITSFYTSGMTVTLGKTVDTLNTVHTSYLQAKETLETVKQAQNFNIILFQEIESSQENYYFPIDLETRLLITIKAGDINNFNSVYNMIVHENTEKRTLHSEQHQNLLRELAGSLTKLKSQLPEQLVRDLNETNISGKESLEFYRNVFTNLCQAMSDNKKSHNNRLIFKITKYIEEHYDNYNLGLFMVATEFSITESYLSHFFKEQTGQNFSSFIEKKRIDKAAELLANTELAIHAVAKQVGYSSDKTFRRVFRKNRGVSPSEYRQDLILNRQI